MAQEKFAVRLSEEDRAQLEGLIRRGQRSVRVINRARILLKTDEGWRASQVATALDTSQRTVFRTKRRYAEEGLYGVLHDHWTLHLLPDKVVELGVVPSLSYETVRFRLKKTPSSPGRNNGEFVAAMEDVLDLYAEPYDPNRPVVCFDETST